jgi:hypothetical protein
MTAHAVVLSADPGNSEGGSPPVERSTWNWVNSRHPAYVRGHLLNKHLHGPGAAYNLTPLTDTVNKAMSDAIEQTLKERVLERGLVYEYMVEAVYDGHPPHPDYDDEMAKQIPSQVILQWRRLAKAPGKVGTDPADWKPAEPITKLPIAQTLPALKDETQRGKKRYHQLVGQFMEDPEKVPKESKVQQSAWASAQGATVVTSYFAPPAVEDAMQAAEAQFTHKVTESGVEESGKKADAACHEAWLSATRLFSRLTRELGEDEAWDGQLAARLRAAEKRFRDKLTIVLD